MREQSRGQPECELIAMAFPPGESPALPTQRTLVTKNASEFVSPTYYRDALNEDGTTVHRYKVQPNRPRSSRVTLGEPKRALST